jgi:foldase protein PrsA
VSPAQRKRTTPGKGAARADGLRRLVLAGFGTLFILLFLIFAVAEGIGHPSVPDGDVAIVEDVPGDIGAVTMDDFDRALAQAAARTGTQTVPKPGDPQYNELKTTALGFLLDTIWLQGQADEMGIDVSQRQVDSKLKQIRKQEFKSEKEYRDFLKQAKFTQEDVDLQVKLQLLSDEIQQQVVDSAPKPSDNQIEAYYEAAKAQQFTTAANRDVRLILNKDRGKVEQARKQLEQDDSAATWENLAKQLSTDSSSKDNGGLREGLTDGLIEEPLNTRVFAASKGEIVGPVKTQLGWYVFQVEMVTPEETQSLDQARSQINSQLTQSAQQRALETFIEDYSTKWQSRTFCADGFVIDRCANFKGKAHPDGASPACYQANPRSEPDACPAPVQQVVPALPGSVGPLAPKGQQIPQRPRPAGLEEVAQSSLPAGIQGALPPGATTAP